MIYENIKRLCERRGISVSRLEKEAGLGNGVVARWATGNPRLDLIKKVADYFGVTVDDLMKETKSCG